MPFTPIHARRLNLGHPLLSGLSNLWLPTPALSGANKFWDIRGAGYRADSGLLTNGPTWKSKPTGAGVETGVTAKNAYIDLAGFQLSRGLSMMFAYHFRYDGTSSGSNTETGIIFSAGFNGLDFRHGGTAGGGAFSSAFSSAFDVGGSGQSLTLLKSRVASIVTGSTAVTAGQFCTAGFTITPAGTATFNIYSQGKLLATASDATTFTGQAPTTLGWDNLTPGTDDEYGRHTILAAALWNGRVLDDRAALQWHIAAQKGFQPLFNRRRAFYTTGGTVLPSDFLPRQSRSRPALPPPPIQPARRQYPFLLDGSGVSVMDWQPFMRLPRPRVLLPQAPTLNHPSLGWLFAPGLRPPGGLTKNKAKPYLNRVPVIPGEESQVGFARLARFATVLSNQWNSLVRQGILVQTPTADSPTGADGFQVRASAHVDTRDPGAMDDSSEDYLPGMCWVNSVTKKAWFCTSNTPGAATWSGPF